MYFVSYLYTHPTCFIYDIFRAFHTFQARNEITLFIPFCFNNFLLPALDFHFFSPYFMFISFFLFVAAQCQENKNTLHTKNEALCLAECGWKYKVQKEKYVQHGNILTHRHIAQSPPCRYWNFTTQPIQYSHIHKQFMQTTPSHSPASMCDIRDHSDLLSPFHNTSSSAVVLISFW